MTEGEINDAPGVCKRTRFHSGSSSTEKAQEAQCFFCRQPAGTDGVHKVATFQMDSKVRDWATILEDTELLGRLSAGEMVTKDAKYHKKRLSVLHNRVRKAKSEGPKYKANEREVSGIVFAVLYIEEATMWCLIAVHARLFIWGGGNVALHGLITHCTLINFRKCCLHVFYLDHF